MRREVVPWLGTCIIWKLKLLGFTWLRPVPQAVLQYCNQYFPFASHSSRPASTLRSLEGHGEDLYEFCHRRRSTKQVWPGFKRYSLSSLSKDVQSHSFRYNYSFEYCISYCTFLFCDVWRGCFDHSSILAPVLIPSSHVSEQRDFKPVWRGKWNEMGMSVSRYQRRVQDVPEVTITTFYLRVCAVADSSNRTMHPHWLANHSHIFPGITWLFLHLMSFPTPVRNTWRFKHCLPSDMTRQPWCNDGSC